MNHVAVTNRTTNGSGGRTDTDQNVGIGTMIEDATTMGAIATTDAGKATIEIDMNGTTHQITTREGMLMTGTGMIGTKIITVTGMVAITLQATTRGGRTNEKTTKTGISRVTRTDAFLRNGTFGKRIVGSRQRSTNESRIEA